MGWLHKRLNDRGQLALRLEARSTEERRLVDVAAQFLGDENLEPAFSHPGLCLTVLPHRERPAREIWRRVNGPVSLTVQPTVDQVGTYHGVPHGAKARLILLYLQTEAVKTNSRQIELGRSMHAWLRRMGVKPSGTNYLEVNRQSHKIENCLLIFSHEGDNTSLRWRDTIIRGSFDHKENDRRELLVVELSESFYRAIREHPVPVSEAAVRALGERCMAMDIYLWLAYRLHALERDTFVPWGRLFAQFGAATNALKHFKPRFARDLDMALAVYPTAEVRPSEDGLTLVPSPPPLAAGRPRLRLTHPVAQRSLIHE
jgi:Plasmid encoded RepA protein